MVYLLLPAAYLLGSVPFGLLIALRCGVDIRERGSGNIGATNVWRNCGPAAGLPALLLDILKGYLPTVAAQWLAPEQFWLHIGAGALAMLGHSFSVFLRFRGGKGVATGCGIGLALSPPAAGLTLLAFMLTVALTRYVSLGSLVGAVTLGVSLPALGAPLAYCLPLWAGVALIFVRHRANIRRLLAGEEPRFELRPRLTQEADE